MLIITVIFLAFISAGIYFYRKKRQGAAGNHYLKRVTPEIHSKTPEFKTRSASSEPEPFEDDALGLKYIGRSASSTDTAEKSPKTESVEKTEKPQNDCVVVMHVMAPEGTTYTGYELLQALLSTGMRFGKQNIFHRHEHKDGRGEV